jgi:hypothetical protein
LCRDSRPRLSVGRSPIIAAQEKPQNKFIVAEAEPQMKGTIIAPKIQALRNQMENTKRSALKLALTDFFLMFFISIVWNYFRKNGVSVIDEFGVAAITAILVYATALR